MHCQLTYVNVVGFTISSRCIQRVSRLWAMPIFVEIRQWNLGCRPPRYREREMAKRDRERLRQNLYSKWLLENPKEQTVWWFNGMYNPFDRNCNSIFFFLFSIFNFARQCVGQKFLLMIDEVASNQSKFKYNFKCKSSIYLHHMMMQLVH